MGQQDDLGPYSPPESNNARLERTEEAGSRVGLALTGFFWSIVLTFPVTAFTALVFRFPVPFAGYVSGFAAIRPAMFAVVVYGLFFGGFVVVGLAGAAAGFGMAMIKLPRLQDRKRVLRWVCLGIATAGVLALAILDWIIGPW